MTWCGQTACGRTRIASFGPISYAAAPFLRVGVPHVTIRYDSQRGLRGRPRLPAKRQFPIDFMLRRSVSRLAALAVAAACTLSSSCGTILHPERIGQPPGRIDPGIVALDGVGLLLFLIPGAIAFAVDFYTGAIYLPPQYALDESAPKSADAPLIAVRVDPRTLTPERIEQVIHEHTGRRVALMPGRYSVAAIESVEQMRSTAKQLAQRGEASSANAVIFRCQSE